jgi:hypothetical protein
MRYNLVWDSLRLITREAVYEKRKLYQPRLNLIFTAKFNDSSILITIIVWYTSLFVTGLKGYIYF